MKFFILLIALLVACFAQIKSDESTFMKTDPDVIYVEDLTDETLVFDIVDNRAIYFTKQGNTKLASVQKGAKAELIAFDQRAYKIKTKGRNGNIVGWVSPHALSCSDPNFIANFSKVYQRQLIVNQLIKSGEVAIGMTPEEVITALGEPTKTTSRLTAKGAFGAYEYTETYQQKHYTYIVDPQTGISYKEFTHTTEEIKSQTIIQFENHSVISIQESINNSIKRPTTVIRPIYLNYRRFLLF